MLDRLRPEHLSSPLAVEALQWLQAHLDDPLAGLPREQEQLVALVTQLVMASEREPVTAEGMEMNFLLLEQRRIEDRIVEAEGKGEASAAPSCAASAPPSGSGSCAPAAPPRAPRGSRKRAVPR